jgi:hypothetical protein
LDLQERGLGIALVALYRPVTLLESTHEPYGVYVQELPVPLLLARGVTRAYSRVVAGWRAKFWVTPEVELVKSIGFSERQIKELKSVVKEHSDEIQNAWNRHFGG